LALLDRFPAETRILGPISLSAFQRDTLEILGLVDRYRATPEHHLTLDDYYYSSFTAMTGCDNPYALQFLRRSFLASASPTAPQPEKIYITRLGSSRSAQDEEQMISILESQGWTIIRTQDYSFREQIALFSNARAVCSIHGAGLTNLVWCQPGCRVLELCPSNFLNGCYEGMSACLGLDYRYLVFEADAHYQMRVDLGEFTAAIAAMGRN
jgi:capsular polysaccharide biosynthesis protein